MALHFGGYEFARASNLAMFTSKETGFGSRAAFPLAMALVTPLSLLLLGGYNNQLQEHGPRLALRHTTLFSIFVIGMSTVLFQIVNRLGPQRFPYGKWIVGMAFIFQNSYAHLLYTQQWSFLGSIMLPKEGASWFSAISGLSSIASTLTGSLVAVLVPRVGLNGLLAGTIITLTLSMLCGDRAYSKAERNGFDPSLEIQKKASEKNSRKGEASKDLSVKAADLFHRVPTLKALFYEVISFQSLSTILNTCFVGQLKRVVTNDAERAAFTGKVSRTCCRMAVVGLVSGCDIPCINLVAQAQTQTHHKTSISSSYGYVCSRINSLCYCAGFTSTSTHTHKHTYVRPVRNSVLCLHQCTQRYLPIHLTPALYETDRTASRLEAPSRHPSKCLCLCSLPGRPIVGLVGNGLLFRQIHGLLTPWSRHRDGVCSIGL